MAVSLSNPIQADSVLPLVTSKPSSESTNIETIFNRLQSRRIIIPDYQRDSGQWDTRKESLFIESVLNNLTVPAFFFADLQDGTIEVVDGQQRLTTILRYKRDEFPLSTDEEVVYLSPQSLEYRGKRFSELHAQLQSVFNDYPLTIISLPPRIDLSTKLEIFRRINEGGTPLTGQDIRLSYYSDSRSVFFLKLVGIYSPSESAQRVIASGKAKGLENPWDTHPQANGLWQDWWEDKELAKGQTPSEMFLWYLVMLRHDVLDRMLQDADAIKHLKLSFRGTTEEALDLYCAQLRYSELEGGPTIFSTWDNCILEEFYLFADWLALILGQKLASVSVQKYKQTALLIGALVRLDVKETTISDDAWNLLNSFLKSARAVGEKILEDIGGYPEQKGRWGGAKGQYGQCAAVELLVKRVIEANP
jgi:Protein of unknown function DUF262